MSDNFVQQSNTITNPYVPNIPSMAWNPLNNWIGDKVSSVGRGIKKYGFPMIPGYDLVQRQNKLVQQPGTTVTQQLPFGASYSTINLRNPDAVKGTIKNMESGLVDYLAARFIPGGMFKSLIPYNVTTMANDYAMSKLFPTKYDTVMSGEPAPKHDVLPSGHVSSAPKTPTQKVPTAEDNLKQLKTLLGLDNNMLTAADRASLASRGAGARNAYNTGMGGIKFGIGSTLAGQAKDLTTNAQTYTGSLQDVAGALSDFDMPQSPATSGAAQISAGQNRDLANIATRTNASNALQGYIMKQKELANALNESAAGTTDYGRSLQNQNLQNAIQQAYIMAGGDQNTYDSMLKQIIDNYSKQGGY